MRVLLVEDSEADAAVVRRGLKRAGYAALTERVDTAVEMRAALERGAWDVVLSDHDMPQFSSTAALRLLRERDLDLPFIIVSGSIGEEVVVNALKMGAQDFVSKNDLSRLGPSIERARREVTDRREQRRAAEALRQSEQRFALAVEASRDGIFEWDIATGQLYSSPQMKEMSGLRAGAEEGNGSLFSQLDEATRARVLAALRGHLEQGHPFDVEFSMVTGHGDERWFRARAKAVRDQEGRPLRLVGALSDLTEYKRTQAELRAQLQVIHEQQEAIRVLSSPIIEVWEGVLTVPVLGKIEPDRAARIMDALLGAVAATRSRYAIIDVTGVASMDAATAEHIVRIARAIQMLGAQAIVVGIQPRVANAIVALGVELSSVMTLANLREALLFCMRQGPGRAAAKAS